MKGNMLVIGRGPSAYRKPIPENDYDIIVKLKICHCDDPTISKRCDILVLYANELFDPHCQYYDVHKHKHKIKHILYFNPFNKSTHTMNHPKTYGMKIKQMNQDYLNMQSVKYGLKYVEDNLKNTSNYNPSPRLSTGLATILYLLKEYSKYNIYLIGFDNLVNDTHLGEFDNPYAFPTEAHDIHKEHKILQQLLSTFSNLHVKTL